MSRSEEGGRVVRLGTEGVPEIVDVFCSAFVDYPVMRFVLGPPGRDHMARLRTLIHFFVSARALRGEPLLGMVDEGALAAAATVSFPAWGESPADLAELREATWRELGADARARYEACGEAWAPLGVEAPHIHLNMIGVHPARQGRGYAGILLRHVHDISRDSPNSKGVSLTTEDPSNVPLYEAAGYEVVGHARIAPDLETWSFFRPD